MDRYVELILPSKPKSAKDTLRHLTWWKEKIGGYTLAPISPDLIAQHRKELSERLTAKGTKRSSATVNYSKVIWDSVAKQIIEIVANLDLIKKKIVRLLGSQIREIYGFS
jgi:hypothetical protein